MDRAKQVYNSQYDRWMPWVEDQYLSWFTNDNKASYAAKGEHRRRVVQMLARG